MSNEKCNNIRGSSTLNIRNGHQHTDIASLRSVSSDDVSGTIEGHCCSAEARNPAVKQGRRIQLLQVCVLLKCVFF